VAGKLKRILKRFAISAPQLSGRDWEDVRPFLQRWTEYVTNILDAGGTETQFDSHQDLEDLQGGNELERYHFTLGEHSYLAPHESALDPHTQYALETAVKVFTLSGTLLSPTAIVNIPAWQAPFACQVTKVRGLSVGGAATGTTINSRKNGSLTHLASDLTLDGSGLWQDGGAVQNVVYAVDDRMQWQITGLGSPRPTAIALELWLERIFS
jgi:hypothetical protein